MKKTKRNSLIIVLVVVLLALAIGYAAFSSTLTINGNQVARQGYKKNCVLVEYTPDFQVVRYWNLIGCWISAISEADFDVTSGGNGGRQLTCTFQFDRAEMHMNDDKWDEES